MTESNEPDSRSDAPASSAEETKRKFREALDKKNAKHHASVEATHEGKISHEHGSASQKREFRRKSG